MRYWWVNQNQTYRHEIGGGYLWSPKRRADGGRNPFYEFMREVSPGDIVFSFCDTHIRAIGIASGYCHESPKPTEFGSAGTNWSQIGWRVDVRWRELASTIRPKDHIQLLGPHLPSKYAPLTPEGNGLQNVYLTEVPPPLAAALFSVLGREAGQVADAATQVSAAEGPVLGQEPDLEEWERRVETEISQDTTISETEKKALISARRGQGRFKANVRRIEKACRVTKVERLEHLIASHAKPWRRSSNEERLDGENGLLLTPSIDHLFDKGFISFENDGRVVISSVADVVSLRRMGIDSSQPTNVGAFSEGQRKYLEFHRENVLKVANVAR